MQCRLVSSRPVRIGQFFTRAEETQETRDGRSGVTATPPTSEDFWGHSVPAGSCLLLSPVNTTQLCGRVTPGTLGESGLPRRVHALEPPEAGAEKPKSSHEDIFTSPALSSSGQDFVCLFVTTTWIVSLLLILGLDHPQPQPEVSLTWKYPAQMAFRQAGDPGEVRL